MKFHRHSLLVVLALLFVAPAAARQVTVTISSSDSNAFTNALSNCHTLLSNSNSALNLSNLCIISINASALFCCHASLGANGVSLPFRLEVTKEVGMAHMPHLYAGADERGTPCDWKGLTTSPLYMFDIGMNATDVLNIQSSSNSGPILSMRGLHFSGSSARIVEGVTRITVTADSTPEIAIAVPAVFIEDCVFDDTRSVGRSDGAGAGAAIYINQVFPKQPTGGAEEGKTPEHDVNTATVVGRSSNLQPLTGLVSVRRTSFTNNVAGLGAAVAGSVPQLNGASLKTLSRSSPWFYARDCVFANNRAYDHNEGYPQKYSGRGGAIYVSDSMEFFIRESNFTDNVVHQHFGGAAYLASGGVLRTRGCFFIRNSALHGALGGAIGCGQNAAFICDSDCHFYSNNATDGGALYGGNRAFLSVNSSIFANNLGFAAGGALFVRDESHFVATDSYFVANRAPGQGGGIFASSSSWVELQGATYVINNTAKEGAGIFCSNSRFRLTDIPARQFGSNSNGFACSLTPPCSQCKAAVPAGLPAPCGDTYKDNRGCGAGAAAGGLPLSPVWIAAYSVAGAMFACCCLLVVAAAYFKRKRGNFISPTTHYTALHGDVDDEDMDAGMQLLDDDFDDDQDSTTDTVDETGEAPLPFVRS